MATKYTVTEADVWIEEKWSKEILMLPYEEQVFAPLYDRLDKPGKLLHLPKHANLSRNTLPDGTAGDNLTFSANTETEVTAAPSVSYIAVQVDDVLVGRMMSNPNDMLRRSMESSVLEGVDLTSGLLIPTLTTNVTGGTDIDITPALITYSRMLLGLRGKSHVKQKGGSFRPKLVLYAGQLDHLLNVEQLAHADIRGDSENPVVSGWVDKAYGCDIYETGNVALDDVAHNAMFTPQALGIAFNTEYKAKRESFQMTERLYLWCDFLVVVVFDEYALDLQTKVALA